VSNRTVSLAEKDILWQIRLQQQLADRESHEVGLWGGVDSGAMETVIHET